MSMTFGDFVRQSLKGGLTKDTPIWSIEVSGFDDSIHFVSKDGCIMILSDTHMWQLEALEEEDDDNLCQGC